MIHKRILVFLIAFLPVIISSCSDDDDDDLIGKWYRVSDMDGLARNYASSFTIGNKGYLICGNDGKIVYRIVGNMIWNEILGRKRRTFPEPPAIRP